MSDTSDSSRARMSLLCKVCSWRPQESQPRRSQNKDRWKRWLAKPCPCTYVLGQCSGKAPNRRYTSRKGNKFDQPVSAGTKATEREIITSHLLALHCHSLPEVRSLWVQPQTLLKPSSKIVNCACEIIRCIHGQEEEFMKFMLSYLHLCARHAHSPKTLTFFSVWRAKNCCCSSLERNYQNLTFSALAVQLLAIP